MMTARRRVEAEDWEEGDLARAMDAEVCGERKRVEQRLVRKRRKICGNKSVEGKRPGAVPGAVIA